MTLVAPTKSQSEAIQLSDKLLKEGLGILVQLDTAQRAKRMGDPISYAVRNVISWHVERACHVEFVRFLEKTAKADTWQQKLIVERLLEEYYKTTDS